MYIVGTAVVHAFLLFLSYLVVTREVFGGGFGGGEWVT